MGTAALKKEFTPKKTAPAPVQAPGAPPAPAVTPRVISAPPSPEPDFPKPTFPEDGKTWFNGDTWKSNPQCINTYDGTYGEERCESTVTVSVYRPYFGKVYYCEKHHPDKDKWTSRRRLTS